MIYFSFIGNHDKISSSNEYGAFYNIFINYKNDISKIFVFTTPKTDRADYTEIANENIKIIKSIKKEIEITPVQIDLANPVDFDLVYPKMLDALLNIIEENNIKDDEKIINITSGTPTMSACWVLLAQSGLIKNTKLVQSFEQQYSRSGKTTREVNFDIDDFPTIKAPSALKRQLTITSRENKELKNKLVQEELDRKVPDLIGTSKAIRDVKDQIVHDINDKTHVLIIGERGTGKEVIANSIWKLYHKKNDEKLKTVDCGSFPKELIQSELFGHTKNAFTGANTEREGILSLAKDKMIFLDEIGNLSLDGQQKLLRVLSHGEIRKLGSDEVDNISIQIIAATNKNIDDPELFAQDIKDRFDEIISLPPLKNRKEDIPLLIDHFMKIYSGSNKTLSPIQIDKALYKKLINFDWPGNIRQLEKWVQKIIRRFSEGGTIKLENLPERFIDDLIDDNSDDFILPELPLLIPLDDYVEKIREKARKMSDNNMSEVDRLLNQKLGTEKQRQYRERNKKE